MNRSPRPSSWPRWIAMILPMLMLCASGARGACCYFAAQDKDINQPGQKAFITFDPGSQTESFTVQPKFEGDARDFGMVVPTPSRPTLDEMPRDFFKHLAIYTILMPLPKQIQNPLVRVMYKSRRLMSATKAPPPMAAMERARRGVRVLEAGVVGSLDYKIITAEDARGLFLWLDENGYAYAGDEGTLDHYISKDWIFTVMKIDTNQMKKGPDGSYLGEVTPTRFQFSTRSLVYPLKITAISVRDRTEALFYVQAPREMDLEGTWSWKWSYRVMYLTSGRVCLSQKQLTPEEREELTTRQSQIEKIRREIPGYDTTKLEWARRLDELDTSLLEHPEKHYGQYGALDWPKEARVIDLDALKDAFLEEAGGDHDRSELSSLDRLYPPGKGKIVALPAGQKGWFAAGGGSRAFFWMPDREAPSEEVRDLGQLKGHLKPGQFLTKFRKVFTREEMIKDLEIVPVPEAEVEEYFRILPQSPP